jgi:hypothetical protein
MDTQHTQEAQDTQEASPGLDIRTPIGFMFTILGLIVTGYGMLSNKAIYARSLGINVNLWWGLVLLAFGLVFLWLGRKGTSAMHSAGSTPEAR